MRPTQETSSDRPQLTERSDGYQVEYRGRRLYANGGPRAAAAQRAARQTIRPETFIIVPSPLLGYGMDVLLQQLPERCRVFAVEVDPRLADLAREHLPREIVDDPRVSLSLDGSEQELSAVLTRANPGQFRRVQLITLSGGFALAANRYRALVEAADERIRLYWQNRATTIFMGRQWLGNLISNLPMYAASIHVALATSERPVVVLGAGPSLGLALRVLQAHRNAGRRMPLIIAADTAFPACRSVGIDPDLVVALEAQSINVIDFVGVSGSSSAAALDLTSHAETARRFPENQRYFFASGFAETSLLDRLDKEGLLPRRLPALGSVGVVATELATRLSAGPMFLCGLDFAVLPDATHGPGTTPNIRHGSVSHRLTCHRPPAPHLSPLGDVERIDCSTPFNSYTTALLRSYRDQLAQLLLRAPNRIYNANRYGFSLEHTIPCCTEEMLGSALHTHCKQEPATPAPLTTTAPQPEASVKAHGFLQRERESLLRIATLARAIVADAADPEFSAATPHYQELCGLLELCDYLSLGFPDRDELPTPTVSFVSRIAAAASFYVDRVNRALAHQ